MTRTPTSELSKQGSGCSGRLRPLTLAELDAAISATIDKPVRRDRLARDDRVYRWLIRRSHAEGSLEYLTTYAEAARGAGYEVPRLTHRGARKEARNMRVSTVYRALCSLAAAGLVDFAGAKRDNGQWRCLRVRLRERALRRPPMGSSRRRPVRCGNRVVFQSGTSPAVVPRDKLQTSRLPSRARARGDTNNALTGRNRRAIRETILEAVSQDPRAHRAPPGLELRYGAFELTEQELVEVCEAFELAYGREANFSFRRHGPRLRRILARFDRYTGPGWQRGAGLREAVRHIRLFAEDWRAGVRSAPNPHSLAYFLPLLDEVSKRRRRIWKTLNPGE